MALPKFSNSFLPFSYVIIIIILVQKEGLVDVECT